MNSNFMLSDLLGVSEAFFLFALFIFIPGYVCGWLVDALAFRRRTLLARFAISVPLSIGISPILAYTLWHWQPRAGWAVFAAMWIGFAALFWHERRVWLTRPVISKRKALFLAITAGWVVLGIACLIDLQIKHRLYFPVVAYDYMFRAAVTASITRTGVPPHNPYFFPGKPFALRYHYFWFVLCSLVNQIGGNLVSPRQAMIAGTVWAGIGLIAVIPLYLRFFQPKGPANLDKRMLLGIALLSVTGLDILPVMLLDLFSGHILASIEWWNTPVMAWLGAVLWVPHHVAGLVACLTGFLLMWYERDRQRVFQRVLTSVAAGFMFASALGLSVYVTFVFAVFLTIWITIEVFRKRFREAGMICTAGAVALALCLPYLSQLMGGHAAGGPFLQLTIRPFRIAELLLDTGDPAAHWRVPVANALLLPLNYFLELGFFFVIAVTQWRRIRTNKKLFDEVTFCGCVMAATSVLLCTFARSGVIANNDLGVRGFLIAQFVLLIWGAELLDEGLLVCRPRISSAQQDRPRVSNDRRILVIATLIIGLSGTVYDACRLRLLPLIADSTNIHKYKWLSPDRKLGERTYALRQLYERAKQRLPEFAVMQHNPDTDPGDLFYGLYADRQLAAEGLGCGIVFGGNAASCAHIIGPIADLFKKTGVVDPAQVEIACNSLSIDALIVKDTDPVWLDKNSWVWKKQPFFANEHGRAFACGPTDRRGSTFPVLARANAIGTPIAKGEH